MTQVRIPGKVMLSGEYAVLYGGTAVMLPVDRWLTAEPDPDQQPELTSPVVQAGMELRISELSDYEQLYPPEYPQIDYSQFFQHAENSDIKLGLGASAAEAVGTVALRFEMAGQPWTERRDLVFQYANAVHHKAQGGIGSGADVAACCFGRRLHYRLEDRKPVITPVVSPTKSEHSATLIWTGRSADSRVFVDRFNAWVESGGRHSRELVSRLVASADDVAREWFKAAWTELYSALTDFVVIISRCAHEAGVPYKSDEYREIESWVIKHGGKAKPVGAGGGDMVLALGDLPFENLDKPQIRISI